MQRIDPNEPSPTRVCVSLTEEQVSFIDEMCAHYEFTSRSAYLRQLIIDALEQEK